MNRTLVLILLVAVFACASQRTIIISRDSAPPSWNIVKEADDSVQLNFFIALPQQNLDLLESIYWDRTNPDSLNYREWMSIETINDLVAAPVELQTKVLAWLKKDAGITQYKAYGDAIEVTAAVGQLKQLFSTSFFLFEHEDGRRVVRMLGELSVPADIAACIDMITGLANFPQHRSNPTPQKSQKRFDWNTYIVPQSLYNIYSIPAGTAVSSNTSQAVIEWEGQYFNPSDLEGFATNMAVPNLNPVTPDHIIGLNNPSNPGDESTLDIQWIAATGINAENWFWIEGGTAWLYGFAVHFMNTADVPLVNSMSYGWNEEDQCEMGIGGQECSTQGLNSTQYVQRVNVEFQKIGLRGVTLFAASGDSGANGRTDTTCTESHFNPAFPAASPFVTAVGATQLVDAKANLQNPPPVCQDDIYWDCASGGTEQAVSYDRAGFASGGGFSDIAPMPAFQQSAVAAYLATPAGKLAPPSYFNAKGRAFPDMAALGSGILIWLNGRDQSVAGTSCSCPIAAGVFTLLNDYALKTTKKPLGPVNQLIYKMAVEHPAAFTDITVGDNTCTEAGCGIPVIAPCLGFYATTGWDPVSGWGTPVYTEMLAYLKKVLAA